MKFTRLLKVSLLVAGLIGFARGAHAFEFNFQPLSRSINDKEYIYWGSNKNKLSVAYARCVVKLINKLPKGISENSITLLS